MIYEAISCRYTMPCLIIWTAHFLRFVLLNINSIDLYRAIVTVLQYNSRVLLWYLQKSCAISGGTKSPWSRCQTQCNVKWEPPVLILVLVFRFSKNVLHRVKM